MSTEPTGGDLTLHFMELEGVLDRVERSSSHYQILGLERSATTDQIGLAQRQTMSLLNPPDLRHATLPESMIGRINEATQKVVDAYSVLGNFGSRVEYDNSLVRRVTVPLPLGAAVVTARKAGVTKLPPMKPLPMPDLPKGPEPPISASPPIPENAEPPTPVQPASVTGVSSTGLDQETIDIMHFQGQVLYTKEVDDSKGVDKRRYQRLRLSIPAQVTGYDREAGRWSEVGHTLDVSIGGVSVQLAKEMREGLVVHLTLPMPTKLRRHGYSDPTYQVYAIVRRVAPCKDEQGVVGLEFLGASPPPGYLKQPWAKFQTKW